MTKTGKKHTIKCKEIGCNKYYYARGLCRKHYKMLLGKEGGYAKEYARRKDNIKYKQMKQKSDKKYRDRLKEEGVLSEKQQEYYRNYISNKDNLLKKRKRANDYYKKNKEIRKEISNAYSRRYRDGLKFQVLNHYSKGLLCCNNCEIGVYSVLTIDHLDNNGADHKRKLSKKGNPSSSAIYKNIIDNKFPEEYQVLCFNCNYLKEFMRKC